MSEKLQIPKLKGEDGHKVLSIRVKDEIIEELDRIAAESNRSRNQIINIMLEFGIKNCEITEQ